MAPPGKTTYAALARNVSLAVITVAMAPLVLVGVILHGQFSSLYADKVYAHLAEVVAKHKENIDSFLQDKTAEVQYLSVAYSYEDLTSQQTLDSILKGIQRHYGRIFVDLGVVDEQGRQVAYAGPYDLLGADYSDAEWFLHTRDRATGISDVFMGLRRSPHFIIAINNVSSGQAWTLRATIDFLSFSNLVENLQIGETGYAYIVNGNGDPQTRAPSGRRDIEPGTARNVLLTPPVEGVAIRTALDGAGEEVIIVSSDLEGGEWQLVYLQQASDAFSGIARNRWSMLVVFAVGGMGVLLVAVFISRLLMRRFEAMERENQLTTSQLVEAGKMASVGELAAGIAHEINNPVAIMMEEAGWVGDLLEDEGRDLSCGAEVRRALAQVHSQGIRCKEITRKLLGFSRQEESPNAILSLNQLIREVVELTMQEARYARVDFVLDIPADLPPMEGSATELQQVFLNLFNNAIQAMRPVGGKLRVSCAHDRGFMLVAVEDTGPGIPEAIIDRVFDPFFTTKPTGKGSGLGLSICSGIIHRMGGAISVRNLEGQGTRFEMELPLHFGSGRVPPAGEDETGWTGVRDDPGRGR